MRGGRFTLTCIGAALLVFGVARAQDAEAQLYGKIVSIRADIVQMRPRFATALKRIVLDKSTVITKRETINPSQLKTGMFLFGQGDYTKEKGLVASFLMLPEARTGFLARKTHGVTGSGYGNSVFFGGTIKTVTPLVITDDEGKDLAVPVGELLTVMQMTIAPREALKVGDTIFASGEKTVDGLLHAKDIRINRASGGEDSLFGQVIAIHDKTVTFKPLFDEENVTITLADNVKWLRQIAIDPDTVKPGDTLTVQGKRIAGTKVKPEAVVAYVLLGDKQPYPQPAASDPSSGAQEDGSALYTGKVASLCPFILTLDTGATLTVTISGQTPLVNLRPALATEIKPGDKLMIIGTEGKEGGMVASVIVLGASSIVGFGN